MFRNPVKFAVVREDPRIEDALVRRVRARTALLVASGGCTALTLKSLYPDLELTLLDPNAAQLERVERKLAALGEPPERRAALFGVGREDRGGLNASGEFESLFRSLRGFLEEFVLDRSGWMELFGNGAGGIPAASLERVFSNAYWPVAFDLHFSDSLLNTMFTPAATQHARPGSYPRYFQAALERALALPGARYNYFLHHIFLGHYLSRREALPEYLRNPPVGARLKLVEGSLDSVSSFGEFDLIHLSNIFDWMDQEAVTGLARRIAAEMRPDACVVTRQLNNPSDFRPLFPGLEFSEEISRDLLSLERSGFYSAVHAGIKNTEKAKT